MDIGSIIFEIIENYAVMKKELIIFGAIFLTVQVFGQAPEEIFLNPATEIETGSISEESSLRVTTHYIGEYYGGGVVFYVDEEGKHGLITTTIDKSTRKQQKSETFILTNPVRDGITTGKFNTERINVMKGEGANDAQEIDNQRNAILSEWYLPTRYDLIKMYNNRAVLGGYTEFARGWKSTEVSSINQWFESFVTGGEFSNGKDDAVYIRVIREF